MGLAGVVGVLHDTLGAFGLQCHVGDLRDHVLADASEYQHVDAVANLGSRESASERTQPVDG